MSAPGVGTVATQMSLRPAALIPLPEKVRPSPETAAVFPGREISTAVSHTRAFLVGNVVLHVAIGWIRVRQHCAGGSSCIRNARS